MTPSNVLVWLSRALVAALVVVGAVIAGGELRTARDQAAAKPTPRASSTIAATVQPSVVPTASGVDPVKGGVAIPPANAAATPYVKPTISPIPTRTYPATVVTLSGRVTAGGRPVAGAQVRVYPANGFQNGPTPVPPTSAEAVTDTSGAYKVSLPAGAYKVGAYVDEQSTVVARDGYWWVTWYGDAYAIGWSKPLDLTRDFAGADIALLHGVRITGRVVGKDGVGVPGAQVVGSVSSNVAYPLPGVTTDGAGTFTMHTVAMKMTLTASAMGKVGPAYSSREIDVRGDMSDVNFSIDRGNIVSGVLRDSGGAPLANVDFAATTGEINFSCCTARTDATGAFAITVPSGTLRFFTWQKTPGEHQCVSSPYTISTDKKLDPTM